MTQSNYTKFLETSYSGRELLKKHSLTETGLWQIFGEDPNCDFGGSHHNPDLGFAEGDLKSVIEYAVELPQFWTWGGGGSIRKVSHVVKATPDTARERARLNEKKQALEKQLAAVTKQLEGL